MFERNLRLATILGIPVNINISWLLVFALVTWSFARGFYPESYPGTFSDQSVWLLAILTALLLFLSVLIHEFSHSIVARRGGLPIRSITLFMFGGVAQMGHEVDDPSLELRMAAAGPLMTLGLAAVFIVSSYLTESVPFVSVLLGTVGMLNILVLIFNMVPGFPLDGGRILRSIIWKRTGSVVRATRIAANIGKGFAWLLVIGGALHIALDKNYVSGIWMIFIAFFLRQAADRSYRHTLWRHVLSRLKVGDVMRTGMSALDELANGVDARVYLRQEDSALVLIGPLLMGRARALPVIGDDGKIVGIVTKRDLRSLLDSMDIQ